MAKERLQTDMTMGSPVKIILNFTIPIFIGNMFQQFYSMADTIIVGKFVGTKALAAVGSVGTIMFLILGFLQGLTAGFSVLTAQRFGAGDMAGMRKTVGTAAVLSVGITIVMTVGSMLAMKPLLMFMHTPEDIFQDAYTYIMIICAGIAASVLYNLLSGVLRALGDSKTPLYFLILSAVLNIGLDLLLILVFHMGAAGAALGTLLARVIEVLIVVFYAVKMNDVVKIHIKDLFVKDKALGKDFFTYAFPVLLNELAWGAGMAAISAIVGHLGSSVVAAHSVAQVCRQLSMVIGFGISNAAAIMIGKAIGEKKEELARQYGKRFVKIAVICGIGGGLLILCISPLVRSLLNLTPLAKSYLTAMMLIMSYYVVGQSVNTTMIVGIFRAGGDTRFGLILDVSVMWLCSIAGAAIGAFVIGIPMPWIYILLCSDEIIKIPFSVYRYRTYKWLKNVTR